MPLNDPSPRLIPQNLPSEEAILGAMLAAPGAIETAQEILHASDFYDPHHRLIYSAIMECAEKGAVDELTVVTHLRHTGKLKDAGGSGRVLVLAEAVPSVANARAYAEEVRAQSVLRQLWYTTTAITEKVEQAADSGMMPEQIVDYAVQEIDSVSGNLRRGGSGQAQTADALSDWVITHLDEPADSLQRFPYPLPTLQEHSGGFARGELITVGGYSGDGKSVMALQMLEHCAKNGARIGYWSLEMPAEQIELRMISTYTAIPVLKLKQPWLLDMEQKQEVRDAANKLRELDFTVYSGGTVTSRIVTEQRRRKYDVIVCDHLHRQPGSEDPKQLPRLVTPMKDVALDTNCASILLCQLNRDADRGYPMPNPNRLKGGNVILDESDACLFVYRERDTFQMPLNRGSIVVAKMRDGMAGYTVPVTLDTNRIKFVERNTP